MEDKFNMAAGGGGRGKVLILRDRGSVVKSVAFRYVSETECHRFEMRPTHTMLQYLLPSPVWFRSQIL